MTRYLYFVYGVLCHLGFLLLYVYLTAFLGNGPVPKTIDSGPSTSLSLAILVNTLLILAFGLQHSVMARPAFKRVWTRIVPEPIERSTYVLASCLVTILLMWQWRPMDGIIWKFESGFGWWAMMVLFIIGVLMVPLVTLMISHFDLFGTRQVWLHLKGSEYTSLPFRTPMAYSRVRHPLYVGWTIAFWSTPVMTVGHLMFAAAMTTYMLVAVVFEERDLVAHFGEVYEDYRRRVPMFLTTLVHPRSEVENRTTPPATALPKAQV